MKKHDMSEIADEDVHTCDRLFNHGWVLSVKILSTPSEDSNQELSKPHKTPLRARNTALEADGKRKGRLGPSTNATAARRAAAITAPRMILRAQPHVYGNLTFYHWLGPRSPELTAPRIAGWGSEAALRDPHQKGGQSPPIRSFPRPPALGRGKAAETS